MAAPRAPRAVAWWHRRECARLSTAAPPPRLHDGCMSGSPLAPANHLPCERHEGQRGVVVGVLAPPPNSRCRRASFLAR